MRLIRALFVCVLVSLTLSTGITLHPRVSAGIASPSAVDNSSVPDSLASTSTFFTIRRDVRRCASPRCGGFFVRRVNTRGTRCADGRQMTECYVAEIDWNGHSQPEPNRTLIRGELTSLSHRRMGRFGLLRASEVWEAGSDKSATGDFFRVRDLGLRCITHPCLTHHEAKLNTTASRDIAGVELNGAGASNDRLSEAVKAMTSQGGIIVNGLHRQVSGPAGRAVTLEASQFYLRTGNSVSEKRCIKTGCSKQICADEEVVSTCEYRSEYECYRTARCERQANGECGFTKTPELTRCLNRRAR
ncbi:MAG TPA: DUF6748 domain-containing protein [Pyrinomonadaceae bacterium]